MPIDRSTAEANPFIAGKFEGTRSVERPKILQYFRDTGKDEFYSLEELANGTGIEQPLLKKRLATMCRTSYKGGTLDNLVTRSTVDGVTYFGLTEKGLEKIGGGETKKSKKKK